MSFAERVDRQQDAVFRTLGEDAAWSGVSDPVRVRDSLRDDTTDWSDVRAVRATRFIRVRRSQVPAPAVGNTVTLAASGAQLHVIEEPTLDRKGVWTMGVKEL